MNYVILSLQVLVQAFMYECIPELNHFDFLEKEDERKKRESEQTEEAENESE